MDNYTDQPEVDILVPCYPYTIIYNPKIRVLAKDILM